jgi:cobalt-zinc-cadmium efflux system outer membrane protein
MKPITLIFAVWLAVAAPIQAVAAQPYTLEQLVNMALTSNKGVQASAAGVDAARAGITTAGAYPNPEVEFLAGRVSARQAGAAAGSMQTLSVTQRIDLPSQRNLRTAIATLTLDATSAGRNVFLANLTASVKQAYFETLRREAEFRAAEEDLALMQQLYDRAQVRVDAGDAPRGESIKAETELLNAQKNSQSALLRVSRAKSFLRQQVGATLPVSFAIEGRLRGAPQVGSLESLRNTLLNANPELTQLRTELERARTAVDYERSLNFPTVSLRAATDREPDTQNTRLGLVVSVPIWDRRKGPIDEAAARLIQVRSLVEAREFELTQELDSAYQQFQIAAQQVEALESGIVRQAEASLRVAESAYRFGERGILEYFDAQRTLRIARSDLIAAQFDLKLAAVDIERLLATIPVGQR